MISQDQLKVVTQPGTSTLKMRPETTTELGGMLL